MNFKLLGVLQSLHDLTGLSLVPLGYWARNILEVSNRFRGLGLYRAVRSIPKRCVQAL